MSNSCDPGAAARQASLSVGFSRQEYWSGLPFLSPGDLPDTRIEPRSPWVAGRCFIDWNFDITSYLIICLFFKYFGIIENMLMTEDAKISRAPRPLVPKKFSIFYLA